jgi:hypothetical protein
VKPAQTRWYWDISSANAGSDFKKYQSNRKILKTVKLKGLINAVDTQALRNRTKGK